VAKRIDGSAVAATRSGNPLVNLKDDDRVVAAFVADDDAELAIVASDGQVLRTAAGAISIQGPGAAGVAGMKLKAGVTVVAAGPVEFGSVVAVVTDEGTTKVTDTAEIPAKGRATGGVRVVKLKGFETMVSYAWVGRNQQLGAIVAEGSDPRKADPTPVPLTLEPTRRDGPAVDLGHRILALGEYRFR
jgi:DNA gyrase subunit A